MAQLVKTCAGLAIASVKTVNDLAIASAKTVAGLDNTSGGGGGTPAFVDFAIATGSASASSLPITQTIGSGNLVVVGAKWEDTVATPTVADSVGNNYTALTQKSQSGNVYTQLFYKLNATGGVGATITVTFGTTVVFCIAGAWEFSGTPSALEGENSGGNTTGSTWATGSVTTTQNVTALVNITANYQGDGVNAAGTGYTQDSDNANGMGTQFQHRITSSIAAYTGNGTFTQNELWASAFAAFR